MTEITDKVFVNKEDVSSIQHECSGSYESPSGGCFTTHFDGSVITLKNGRKIYVKGMSPKQVLEKLNPQEP